MTFRRTIFSGLFLLLAFSASPRSVHAAAKPKVRTITAFVRVRADNYQDQIHEALIVLRRAQQAYQQRGYEVQTIRITTQPFPDIVRGLTDEAAMNFFHGLNELAKRESFLPNIGPALSKDGDPAANADLLARALVANDQLNGSIVVAQEDGIHWKAIHSAARVIKYLADHSPNAEATFGFAATALLGEYGPFFPGSYHDGPGKHFAIGLESANVVQEALSSHPGDVGEAEHALAMALNTYATECEQVAREIERQTGWTYAGLDPTPAPLADVSIGDAIEKFTGSRFGASGTMTAAALITRAVKSVSVKQVGYSGLMVPVLEDAVLGRRWSEKAFSIDSLLAYSSVCGTGLDTVPLPGDISEEQLSRIIGDVASLAYKWKKPLAARLQPIPGKKAGDKTQFSNPRLGNATLQKLP